MVFSNFFHLWRFESGLWRFDLVMDEIAVICLTASRSSKEGSEGIQKKKIPTGSTSESIKNLT